MKTLGRIAMAPLWVIWGIMAIPIVILMALSSLCDFLEKRIRRR